MKSNMLAVLLVGTALIAPASARAHVSLHPNTIPAGAFATLDVRVPGEQEGAYVTKVDTLLPAGFVDVAYENVPGWTARVIESKLPKPIEADGEEIGTEVSRIVWSWVGPLGKVGDGQFVSFPLSLAIPADAAGRALEFRTVETYSNGQVERWIDSSLSAEDPAPRINVTAKGGAIEDVAGDEAGPAAGERTGDPSTSAPAPSAAEMTDGASEGLVVAALILGALGVALGAIALVSTRRRQPGG